MRKPTFPAILKVAISLSKRIQLNGIYPIYKPRPTNVIQRKGFIKPKIKSNELNPASKNPKRMMYWVI